MANVVYNKVIGLSDKLIKKYLVNENGKVDFNILIPMPKELDIICGSGSIPTSKGAKYASDSTKAQEKENEPIYNTLKKALEESGAATQQEFVNYCLQDNNIFNSIADINGFSKPCKDEHITTYLQGFYNLEKYGYKDWYDFRIDKWGCKWNADSTVVYGGIISFETPWGSPDGIFIELSKHIPIRVMSCDEFGNFGDIIDYIDGEATTVLEDSDAVYDYMFNNDELYVYDDNGDTIEDPTNPLYVQRLKEYEVNYEKVSRLFNKEDFMLSCQN